VLGRNVSGSWAADGGTATDGNGRGTDGNGNAAGAGGHTGANDGTTGPDDGTGANEDGTARYSRSTTINDGSTTTTTATAATARNDDGTREFSHDLTGPEYAQYECRGSIHGTTRTARHGHAGWGTDNDDELKHGTTGSDAEPGDEGSRAADGASVCQDGRPTSTSTWPEDDGGRSSFSRWNGQSWTQADSSAAARHHVSTSKCSG